MLIFSAFLAGLLGSAHCVGMCGALALLLHRPGEAKRRYLLRQLLYTAGRTSSYMFLAAAATTFSLWVGQKWSALHWVVPAVSVVAGALLVVTGLTATGWIGHRIQGNTSCSSVREMAAVFKARPAYMAFMAGAANGFIPCGLLYGVVCMLAASGSVLFATTAAIAFGLGTAPAMLTVGLLGVNFSIAWRARLFAVAGAWLVALGCGSLASGLHGLYNASRGPDAKPAHSEAARESPIRCPFCRE